MKNVKDNTKKELSLFSEETLSSLEMAQVIGGEGESIWFNIFCSVNISDCEHKFNFICWGGSNEIDYPADSQCFVMDSQCFTMDSSC